MSLGEIIDTYPLTAAVWQFFIILNAWAVGVASGEQK